MQGRIIAERERREQEQRAAERERISREEAECKQRDEVTIIISSGLVFTIIGEGAY